MTVLFCLDHDDVVHRWKRMGRQTIWRIICWNLWRNVDYIVIFLNKLGIIDKNTTTTAKRYVNELVSARTKGHLIEKRYQVTGHYLCTRCIQGCPELHFWRVCNGGIRSCGRLYRKTHRLDCNDGFRGYGVTFLTITSYSVVRFSSFIYQTNCIYIGFQFILDMLTYVTPSSNRYTNCQNRITEMKFRQPTITIFFYTTNDYDVNYLQLLVLGVNMHVYNWLIC